MKLVFHKNGKSLISETSLFTKTWIKAFSNNYGTIFVMGNCFEQFFMINRAINHIKDAYFPGTFHPPGHLNRGVREKRVVFPINLGERENRTEPRGETKICFVRNSNKQNRPKPRLNFTSFTIERIITTK